MRKYTFLFVFLFMTLFFCGCSGAAKYHEKQNYSPKVVSMQDGGASYKTASPVEAIAESPGSNIQNNFIPKKMVPQTIEAPIKRMVHYNGYLKISVFHGEETIEKAAKICEEAQGYVESRSNTSITLRIPVSKFQEVFSQIAGLGDVLNRSITAHDVTESYFAVDLHLKTMKTTRDRFLVLLEKARNEQEKIKILQEIRRLTEAIDQLEQQLKTLASLAAYSRLTLEAQTKQAKIGMTPETEPISAFHWIYGLSPFRRDIAMSGRFLKMMVPQGMVALEKEKHWIAESPDGAIFWASKRENSPRGDTHFWMEAIKKRLGPEFRSTETIDAGSFKILQFAEQEPAYKYWVGIFVKENTIHLIEAYFRTVEQENRYKASILSSIEKGEQ